MIRDLDRLANRTFDVLIVGGGIYGLTIARDAALRGLSVALIEQNDFGSGSSFNHLRTIHGGLRYLQTLDIARARESIFERRTLARIAPHAVAPLPFVLPLERSLTRGRLAMRAAFALDRLIAFDRNRGVPSSHRLPGGKVLTAGEAVARVPELSRAGLTGAAVWHDYITTESDRLTFSYALAASELGAELANYARATELLSSNQRVTGVRAEDAVTRRTLDIGATLVVNATGAAVDRLLDPLKAPTRTPLLKAMNLVTSRPGGDVAVGGRSASGRNLFLVPWRGRALFGTWESAAPVTSDSTSVTRPDVEAFIAELNEAFPRLHLSPADVTLVHRGVVPAKVTDGRIALEGHERVRDHANDGLQGIISVVGAKYTTARATAERVTDLILTKLGRPATPGRTAATPLPGGDIDDIASMRARAEQSWGAAASDTPSHLVAAYGSRFADILSLCQDNPALRDRVITDSPVIAAELVWAARHELVVTLADAVMRRTPLGALGYPGDQATARAAAIVGAELGWSEEKQRAEAAAVQEAYRR